MTKRQQRNLLRTIKKYRDAFTILGACSLVLIGSILAKYPEWMKAWAWEYPRVSYLTVEKVVEVEKYVVVSKRAAQCMNKRPDVVEKIKQYFQDEWLDAVELYCRESGLNPKAINASSGACGLVQALPCSKLNCQLDDLDCQLEWGRSYIKSRYGTAKEAVAFHDLKNWY